MQFFFNRISWFVRRLLRVRSFSDFILLLQELFRYPFVDLYGCPNSKRTEKLQLKKRLFR